MDGAPFFVFFPPIVVADPTSYPAGCHDRGLWRLSESRFPDSCALFSICLPSPSIINLKILSDYLQLNNRMHFMNNAEKGLKRMQILVIEDEQKVAEALRKGLEMEFYDVTLAHTGEEGFFQLNTRTFDLVILDLMLPGRDGLEILTALRKVGFETPVLILTARDAVADRVQGLDSGADDYLVKPFAFPELLARIRLLLRRGRSEQALRLKLSNLEMDLVTRRVTRGGELLELTSREYELLEYLLRNQERVVSREMLARHVWQVNERSTPLDNVIDVHIARLRRKVDGQSEKKLIKTVRGIGFVLKEGE